MNTLIDKSQIAAKVRLIFHEKLGVDEAKSDIQTHPYITTSGSIPSMSSKRSWPIEKEFGIKISDEDAEKLTTFGAVSRLCHPSCPLKIQNRPTYRLTSTRQSLHPSPSKPSDSSCGFIRILKAIFIRKKDCCK